MSKREVVYLEQKDILDIVFALIIGNGIIKIPVIMQKLTNSFILTEFISIVLLFTTILFSILYWLEAREFIRTENEISKNTEVKFDLDIFESRKLMLGSFLLVIFSGIMIEYSNFKSFKLYLIFNFMFWISDYFGTILHKRNNNNNIEYFRIECKNLELSSWFLCHFSSMFFNVYGIINSLVYLVLIVISHYFELSKYEILIMSIFLLIFILFRHFYWRISIYSSAEKGIYEKLKIARRSGKLCL